MDDALREWRETLIRRHGAMLYGTFERHWRAVILPIAPDAIVEFRRELSFERLYNGVWDPA